MHHELEKFIVSYKGFAYRIHKEFQRINCKNTNNQVEICAIDLNRYFTDVH